METALAGSGLTTARYLANTVTLAADGADKLAIKIDPDILTTNIDRIRVETSTYALTLKVSDLAADLTEPMTIPAEALKDPADTTSVGSGFMPGKINTKTTVKIDLPKVQMTNPVTVSLPRDGADTTYQAVVKSGGSATASKFNPVTVSLPRDGADTTYQAVVKSGGSATASKFNPATVTMDGKVNSSGIYTVRSNEKTLRASPPRAPKCKRQSSI